MRLLIVAVFALLSFGARAQYFWDVGVNIGAAGYLGDIGGTDQPSRGFIYDMQLSQVRFGGGAFARYRLGGGNFALNWGVQYARIAGADSLTDFPERFGRNLSFRSDMIEAYNRIEYYFYTVRDVGRTGRYLLDFQAFVFVGAGLLYHNPKAFYQGQWVALQPLNTEGPGRDYSRFQPVIPIGLGFFYTMSREHRIGFQIGWRKTFTDYLDDASTFYADPELLSSPLARALADRSAEVDDDPRSIGSEFYSKGAIRGNPTGDDSYLFASVTYSFVIRGRGRKFTRSRGNPFTGRRRVGKTKAKF